jgi:hypothetical protein
MIPPAFVEPNGVYPPFVLRRKSVLPVVEKVDDGDDEEFDGVAYQSNPANAPPRPTVPIFEKSTCGRDDGAGVEAMTGKR